MAPRVKRLFMKKLSLFHIFMFTLTCLFAKEQGTYLIIGSPIYNPGMFSVLHTVIGTLDLYETKEYGGLEIDFGTSGLYYDAKKGANWWTYYLEPLRLGNKQGKKIVPYRFLQHCQDMAHRSEFSLDKFRASEIISNYFQFKPFLLQMVHDFTTAHFSGKKVIGVHYRGTDKKLEAPRVPYNKVLAEIRKVITSEDLLFIATDEAEFLSFIQSHFPDQTLSITAKRSENERPIHLGSNGSGYQIGLEAMLDAHLISRCDLLIRTSSNLSLFSTYLNPNLPTITLNDRF